MNYFITATCFKHVIHPGTSYLVTELTQQKTSIGILRTWCERNRHSASYDFGRVFLKNKNNIINKKEKNNFSYMV